MTENKYLFEKRKNSQKKINKNKLNKKKWSLKTIRKIIQQIHSIIRTT